jgi:hypothetical protein
MIGRLIWFGALAGIALVTTGVQLDRQVRKTPELSATVPELLRSSAQPFVAAQAIESGIAEIGLTEAQRLVRRRPMPARHLRLLAQAQFAAGDIETSTLTIQYAAQRGWREPLAQEAMLQLALVAGDRAEAARRYAALFLMRGTDRTFLEETAIAVFPEAGGEDRAVFAEIVRGGERWHNTFLARGARVMPPEAFAEILEMSIAGGAQFRCRALEQAERVIVQRDETTGARLTQLVEDQC